MKGTAQNILVVDDNAINRKLLLAILEAEGYGTVEASDGEEALQHLENTEIHAIISDILMPGMDGYRFCYEVRKSRKHSTVPFMFLSATYTSPSDEKLALDLGGDKILRKPVSSKEVARELRDVLSNASYKKPRHVTHPKTIEVIEQYRDALVAKLEEKTTELQQTTDDLKASEELFRLITENAADLIAVLDLQGKLLYNSPSYKAFFGDPEKLRGTDSFLAIHPEDRERIRGVFRETISTGIGQRIEYRLVVKDGNVRDVESQGSVVRDEDGKPSKVVVVSRDITGRKKAERALQQSEQKFRLLFEANPHPMWFFDPITLAFLDVNRAAIYHYGFSREEFLSMTIMDIRPPDDVARLVGDLAQRHEGLDVAGQWRHKKKDGTIIHVDITSHAIDYSGKAAKVVLAHDVTKRVLAERELKKLSRAVEQTGDSVAITNKEGVIEYINPAFEQNTGFKKEFAIGKTPAILKSGKHDELFYQRLWDTINAGKVFRDEFINKTKSGRLYYEQQTISPVFDDDGKVQNFVSAGKDITKQKDAAEQLRLAHQQLQELLDHSPAVIFRLKIGQGQVFPYVVSDNITRLLGFTVDESKSFEWWAVHLHPDDKASAFASIEKTLECGALTCEYRLRHKNGEYVWVEDTRRVLRDSAGRSEEIVGVWTDVSERKRTETELRQTHGRLEHLLEHSPAVIYTLKIEGEGVVPVVVSENIERLLGFTVAESMNFEWWSSHLHPDDRDMAFASIPQTIEQGILTCEYRLRHKDLHYIWLEDNRRLVRDAEGRPVEIVGVWTDITWRKEAEEKLQESERRFREMLENVELIAMTLDKNATVTFCNNYLLRLTGWQREQVIGRNWFDLFIPPDDENMKDVFGALLQNLPEAWHHENEILTRTGERRFIHWNNSGLRSGLQEVIGTASIGEDVTEKKRAEVALAASEMELRALFAAMSDIVLVLDTDGRYLQIAPTNPSLLYKPPTDLVGKTIGEILPPAEADNILRYIRLALETNQPVHVEYSLPIGDKIVWFEGTVSPLGKGKVIWIARDLTERKRAQDELETAHDQLRNIFDNLDEVFFSLGVGNNKLLQISPACEKIYGYSPEAFLKNPGLLMDLIHPDDKSRVEGINETQLLNGVPARWECRIVKPDGEVRWIETQAKPTHDASGHSVRIDGIVSDVTEKKRLETQFLRSQRMESIGTLAGGIAHDLNNVLSPIVMGIEMLKKRVTDEASQKMLRTLEASAERGSGMVRQVLAFARGVSGERVVLQPGHVIRELQKIVRETFPKSIQFGTEVPRSLWCVSADATQLHQVLLNLCVNARDAMPGGGSLTISAENVVMDENYALMNVEAKAGPYVILTVADTGTGIAPNLLDKVFDPFFTTKEIGKGTGLGLSTVHTIVKGHGGFINVYSEVGRGTKFRVYLPAEITAEEKQAEIVQLELPVGHGELILVVDDEAAIGDICRATLESYGYTVLTAADGTEAVVQYAQRMNEIQLVITDMMMPFMDGRATIRALFKINPEVKIIATSGLMSKEKAIDYRDLAVRAFLAKPYTASKLLTTVAAALTREEKQRKKE